MVFPSVPVYLDPPNWPQQQPNQHPGLGIQNPQLPPPPSQPLPPPTVGGGSGGHSIRPGSMTDRARLAQLPLPDAALKCPRCESTNTKFCYYNNYSLSQPRHFCKTCRRYWTRGGALRNVPVGGGCRRNKRSKGSNRSKSPAKADRQGVSASTSAHSHSFSNCTSDIIGHLPTPAISQLPFLTSTLHNFNDHYGDIGMHFGAIPPPVVATTGGSDAEFQIGTSSSVGSLLSNGLIDQQWRLPNLQQVHHHQQLQLPLLSNYETPIGLFQFEGENVEPPSHGAGDGSGRLQSKTGISGLSQLTTVKMEENQGLSLSRNITGSGNGQFWTGGGSNAWNDIPSFTSSTSHLL